MQRIGSNLISSQFVSRTLFVILAFVAGAVYGAPAQNGAAQAASGQRQDSRPNIILLLFDDVGYSDMSAMGGEIDTPTIEQVARDAQHFKTIQIVQNAPLARFRDNLQKPGIKHREATKRLLVSYLEQLTEARELMSRKDTDRMRADLPRVEDAIDYITDLLEWKAAHSVGRAPGDIPPQAYL